MGEAIRSLETILDNTPFYPDHSAHLRFQPIKEVYWQMKVKSKWRIHPRWHIWHWRVQILFLQELYRWLFKKCCICNKGFKYKESVYGNWDGDRIWHGKCDHVNYTEVQAIKEGMK